MRLPDELTLLGGHHAMGIAGVVPDSIEVQPADRVLHVELVLERIGNRLRSSDDEQVIGDHVRIGRPGRGALAGEEILLGLARAVAGLAGELPVAPLGLALSVIEQLAECLPDGRVGVVGEDDPPAGLRQLARVDALFGAERTLRNAVVPPPEFLEVVRVDKPAARHARDLRRRHRRKQVCAGHGVDAVEHEELRHFAVTLLSEGRYIEQPQPRNRGPWRRLAEEFRSRPALPLGYVTVGCRVIYV